MATKKSSTARKFALSTDGAVRKEAEKRSTAPGGGEPMNRTKGAPAVAAQYAAVFKTPERLAEIMLELVEEWAGRENKVYAVAEGGRCVAEKRNDSSIEASIFEAIEEQLEDTHYATTLKACINRFKELAEREAVSAPATT